MVPYLSLLPLLSVDEETPSFRKVWLSLAQTHLFFCFFESIQFLNVLEDGLFRSCSSYPSLEQEILIACESVRFVSVSVAMFICSGICKLASEFGRVTGAHRVEVRSIAPARMASTRPVNCCHSWGVHDNLDGYPFSLKRSWICNMLCLCWSWP